MLSDMNNGLHSKSFGCLTDIPVAAQVAAFCSHQQPRLLIKAEVEIGAEDKLAKRIFSTRMTPCFGGHGDDDSGRGRRGGGTNHRRS